MSEEKYNCHKCLDKEIKRLQKEDVPFNLKEVTHNFKKTLFKNDKGVYACEDCGFSLLYENGLKIDNKLYENLKEQINRIYMNFSSMLVIDGAVGQGKTTLAVICGKYISEVFNQEFSIKDQVCMGGKEFMKGVDYCLKNDKSVIIYDEAGDLNSKGALTKFNRDMNRVFDIFRAFGIIVIFCLPLFKYLDNELMSKGMIRGLIHTHSRTRTYGNYSVYSLYRCWWLKENFKRVKSPQDAFKMTHANFKGHSKDLDPLDAMELSNHSIAGKKDIAKQKHLRDKGLMSTKDIAEATGYSVVTIRNYINRNGLEGETHNKVLYYHKELAESIKRQREEGKSISC